MTHVIKSLDDEKMIVFECPLEGKRYNEFKNKLNKNSKSNLKYFEEIPEGLIRILHLDTIDEGSVIYRIELAIVSNKCF